MEMDPYGNDKVTSTRSVNGTKVSGKMANNRKGNTNVTGASGRNIKKAKADDLKL